MIVTIVSLAVLPLFKAGLYVTSVTLGAFLSIVKLIGCSALKFPTKSSTTILSVIVVTFPFSPSNVLWICVVDSPTNSQFSGASFSASLYVTNTVTSCIDKFPFIKSGIYVIAFTTGASLSITKLIVSSSLEFPIKSVTITL